MMTLLKTVLIILLVYFGLKFLIKLLAPYVMRYVAKKAGEKFEKAFKGPMQSNPERKKEGNISFDKVPSKNKKSKSTVGEYVDYEEID